MVHQVPRVHPAWMTAGIRLHGLGRVRGGAEGVISCKTGSGLPCFPSSAMSHSLSLSLRHLNANMQPKRRLPRRRSQVEYALQPGKTAVCTGPAPRSTLRNGHSYRVDASTSVPSAYPDIEACGGKYTLSGCDRVLQPASCAVHPSGLHPFRGTRIRWQGMTWLQLDGRVSL